MDPVTLGALLAAVAGGAGEALGSEVWDGLGELVRRPFRRNRTAGDSTTAAPSGQTEFVALAQAPADQRRAVALAEVLIARADADSRFAADLATWWEQAQQIQVAGNVANTVSGGTQYGPVLQGRDFTGLTFGVSASAPPSDAPRDERRS